MTVQVIAHFTLVLVEHALGASDYLQTQSYLVVATDSVNCFVSAQKPTIVIQIPTLNH